MRMLAEDPARAIMSDGDATDSISVVVPVYNSAESLPELVQRLDGVLAACTPVREVILVNDGSRDRSWDVICQLSAQYP